LIRLPDPKVMDVAVPANMCQGLHQEESRRLVKRGACCASPFFRESPVQSFRSPLSREG
jgi:hypothetical protein